jgi:hypothetical protein
MDIESKARRRVIADSIASLSNAAIDVQGQLKIVIYGRSKYIFGAGRMAQDKTDEDGWHISHG